MDAMLRIGLLLVVGLGSLEGILVAGEAADPAAGVRFSEVGISAPRFNPSAGERVSIHFALSQAAHVTLHLFDADFELVRTRLDGQALAAGPHTVAWDGRDGDGAIVPDEAYFFTIEARDRQGRSAVYDPVTFSGGEMYFLDRADFDKEKGQIRYTLERSGRVSIRMGGHQGPLLRTFLDWEPRPAGAQVESWDGTDASGRIPVRDQPGFVATIQYFTLPDPAVITHGHRTQSYSQYKAGARGPRPAQAARARAVKTQRSLSPLFLRPRTAYRTPALQVTFPGVAASSGESPVPMEGTVMIRVDVPEEDKARLRDRGMEIYLFLDNRFLMEEGRAQLPYQVLFDFSRFPEGEQVLTVNLLTDDQRVATVSRRVHIRKPAGAAPPGQLPGPRPK